MSVPVDTTTVDLIKHAREEFKSAHIDQMKQFIEKSGSWAKVKKELHLADGSRFTFLMKVCSHAP